MLKLHTTYNAHEACDRCDRNRLFRREKKTHRKKHRKYRFPTLRRAPVAPGAKKNSAMIIPRCARISRELTSRHDALVAVTAFLISVASSFGINWAQSPPYMLTLAAAVIVTTRIAGNIVSAVNADVIPVPLR